MVAQEGIVGRTQPGYTPLLVVMTPPGVVDCLDAAGKLCSANAAIATPPPELQSATTGGSVAPGVYTVEVTYVSAGGQAVASAPTTITVAPPTATTTTTTTATTSTTTTTTHDEHDRERPAADGHDHGRLAARGSAGHGLVRVRHRAGRNRLLPAAGAGVPDRDRAGPGAHAVRRRIPPSRRWDPTARSAPTTRR